MVQVDALIFNEIPKGKPIPGQTLKKVQLDLDLDAPLKDGEILVKTTVLSLDPYMRGRCRPEEVESYVPAFKLGQPVDNFAVAEVVKSSNHQFKKGQHVYGSLKFQTYQVVPKEAAAGLRVLENKEGLPWTNWVGAAGMPGQTAWYGIKYIGQLQKGESIFISGAMGPVGQIAIALAHRIGAKVIASAGSKEKCDFLKNELKVERVFNYKEEDANKVLAEWNKEQGKPFEVYLDNVAGPQLEAALNHIAKRGRIIAIGAINDYNGEPYGIKNIFYVVGKELRYEGFIILNRMTPELFKEFYSDIPPALASGEFVKPKEHVFHGLDNGEAFASLFDTQNSNFGKAVISLE